MCIRDRVDVDSKTFNIDVSAIEKVIGPKTKVIVPVHLFGQAADMDEIMALAKKNNLYVVEDNAQSIGADYTFADGKKRSYLIMTNPSQSFKTWITSKNTVSTIVITLYLELAEKLSKEIYG